MRLSREAKAQHHEEIIQVGARMLRERGIEGTSVADLMQAAGLTHGGFYRHFESKDAFVREATIAAFNNVKTVRDTFGGTATQQLAAYGDYYLSNAHLTQPALGCPIAAFGGEVTRAGAAIQDAFASGVDDVTDWIALRLAGEEDQRRSKAGQILAVLVGAVVAARACGSSEVGQQMLASARQKVAAMLDDAAQRA